jgi:hypothetical protein
VADPPEVLHTCPRRLEMYGRYAQQTGTDRWERGRGLIGQDATGLSCSFCGSLAPDRFMQLVREGWWVDPTDKAYKAYLAEPLTDDQVAAARSAWMSGTFVARVRNAVREDNAESVDAAIEQEWQQMPAASGHGREVAKFYYQHLNSAQMDEFIALINAKKMRIGMPGHFYVLPFFCQPTRQEIDG